MSAFLSHSPHALNSLPDLDRNLACTRIAKLQLRKLNKCSTFKTKTLLAKSPAYKIIFSALRRAKNTNLGTYLAVYLE